VEVPSDIDVGHPIPTNGLIEAALNSQSVLVFGQRPEELRSARRRPRAPAPEQGLLFNWT
jgi:hypothetical protein